MAALKSDRFKNEKPDRKTYQLLPLWMEDFVVTYPLVPSIPHLISGSCSSSRIFGLGFLQTPSHDDALALLLTFGSMNTWYGISHPASYETCLAHTLCSPVRNIRGTSKKFSPKYLATTKIAIQCGGSHPVEQWVSTVNLLFCTNNKLLH